MTYLVYTEDGGVVTHTRPATMDHIRADLGDYADLVECGRGTGIAGWVPGNGLNEPHRYRLNHIAGVVAATLGAVNGRQYAGPMAVTGYDPRGEGRILELTERQILHLGNLHAHVLRALDGNDFPTPEWAQSVRVYVASVRKEQELRGNLPPARGHR